MELKRGFKELLISQGYKNIQKTAGIGLIILIIALIVFSSYFLFFHVRQCENADCFVDAMTNCKRFSWIREDIQASWLYTITGNAKGDICNVEVQLLEIKQGSINNEEIQGKKMTCTFLKSKISLPEKDLLNCEGELKEKLQEMIIQKMHNYLLKNVGEVRGEFGGI